MAFLGKINIALSDWRRNLRGALHDVFGLLMFRVYLIIAIIINLLGWLGAVWLYQNIGQELTVLHYNVDFGIDLIGDRAQIFLNPILGLSLIILNIVLALLLSKHKDFKFICRLLVATMILANIFLLLALLAVYLINFL